jgi:N-acetylglucosaminyl-diphospho-decaprenol L-rhamnosyltransferase
VNAQRAQLSVIIVSWNGWQVMNECLRSLFAQNLAQPPEVIVIDNGSGDGSAQLVRDHFPDVLLHRFETNRGHTKAVNFGFAMARGELVLLLDQDTELLPGCVPKLLAFMRERPDVSMVAPRTFNTDGTTQESARALPTPMSAIFGRQSTLTRLWPSNPFSRGYLMREHLGARVPFRVEQIGGACMLFRREVLERAGPWDESYFGYWVDTDWCCRLKALGLAIYCVPDAHIVHHEGNARRKRKSVNRIWMFHCGAWQLYTRWHTFGPLDPRAILAGAALGAHAVMQLAINAAKSRAGTEPAGELLLKRREPDGQQG